MRDMKRVFFVLAIIVVLTVASTAFAGGGGGRRKYVQRGGPARIGQSGGRYGHRGMKYGGCGMMMYGGRGAGKSCPMWGGPKAGRREIQEIPQEIRDKMREMKQITMDLKKEWGNKPINREKILEFHAKQFSLIQEISEWRLNQRLNALEAESEQDKPEKDKPVKNKPVRDKPAKSE